MTFRHFPAVHRISASCEKLLDVLSTHRASNIPEELGTMSENNHNLREITFGMRSIWGIHYQKNCAAEATIVERIEY